MRVLAGGGAGTVGRSGCQPHLPAGAFPFAHHALPFSAAEELRYDLHVLLVRHGKACPHCAKTGSAKQQAAASSGVACPLADLKPPRSKLAAFKKDTESKAKGGKGGKSKQQQQQPSDGNGPAAVAAGAAGNGSKRRKVSVKEGQLRHV